MKLLIIVIEEVTASPDYLHSSFTLSFGGTNTGQSVDVISFIKM
jgi:hypothetical protein